jgi:hypothetical protein
MFKRVEFHRFFVSRMLVSSCPDQHKSNLIGLAQMYPKRRKRWAKESQTRAFLPLSMSEGVKIRGISLPIDQIADFLHQFLGIVRFEHEVLGTSFEQF